MVDPHMWTLEHKGIVKFATSSLTPFLRVHLVVTGITAEDEQMLNPVRYAGSMFHRHLNGFFRAMAQATTYWITRKMIERITPVRIIFAPDPSTTPITPFALISQIIVKMYQGSRGMMTFSMVSLIISPNSSNAFLRAFEPV